MGYQLLIERLQQLARRIQDYWSHPDTRVQILVELAVIWLSVYLVLRYLRGTRGARAIKGMVVILIVATILVKLLATDTAFERLNFLYNGVLGLAALALVVVFQPELRRLMVRLGEARLFFGPRRRRSRMIEEIVASVVHLGKNKIGALIALERNVGLKGIVEGGTALDAEVTRELLNTIFWPGSALHDMGVLIQGDRLAAAGVQFPLAEDEGFEAELGSRHRAAIGLTQESDALVIVVSEETGTISIASRGKLIRGLDAGQLHQRLAKAMRSSAINADAEVEAPNGQPA